MTSSLRAFFGAAIRLVRDGGVDLRAGLRGAALDVRRRQRFAPRGRHDVEPDGTGPRELEEVRRIRRLHDILERRHRREDIAGRLDDARRIEGHRDGHSRGHDRAAVAAKARGNLAIVLPLDLSEELAEIGHAFAERHVLRVGAARRAVAQQHVEQPILDAGNAVAHVRAVLGPLSGIDAHAETAAPAFHGFHRLRRAAQHRDGDTEFFGERVETGEIGVARDNNRRRTKLLREVENPAARRCICRQVLDAVRADANVLPHARLDGGNLGSGQVVIEVLLNLRTHALRARCFDERHERRIGSHDRFQERETHPRYREVPVGEPIVGDQRAGAPRHALERVGRPRKRRRLVLLRHQRRHTRAKECGHCDSHFHDVTSNLRLPFTVYSSNCSTTVSAVATRAHYRVGSANT